MNFEVEHVGGCNALCDGDRHYLFGEPVDQATVKPLGDEWVDVGYSEDERP